MAMRLPFSGLCALVLLTAPFAGSCVQPTRFIGEAKVPDGPNGCRARCTQWGLEFAGMVAMGEYSDGCICQVPNKPVAPTAAGQAAVGVVLQMQAEEEAQRRRTTYTPASSPSYHR
jgi:hypothetical protein